MKINLLTAFSACFIAVLPATASIVVPNGGFELVSGTVAADWVAIDASDMAGAGFLSIHGEVFGHGGKIVQNINLGGVGVGPPVTYQISFYAKSTIPGATFGVQLDASGIADQIVTGVYAPYVVDLTTTALGLQKLAFTWNGIPGAVPDGYLDNVTVTALSAVPVPEPATLISGALLVLPFGASTLRILRRNRAV